MFKIRFKITENLELLPSATLRELDDEYYNICGCFELKVRNHETGFYMDELPKEVFGSEILTLWFSVLLDVLLYKKHHGDKSILASRMYDIWLGFNFHDGLVDISEVEIEAEDAVMSSIVEAEKYSYKTIWFEKDIPYHMIENEILSAAETFVEMLKSINPLLLQSSEVALIINELHQMKK